MQKRTACCGRVFTETELFNVAVKDLDAKNSACCRGVFVVLVVTELF